ncbi:hypothetical protein QQS21_003728 [Conoideocrella luteorostrata]|uniref:Uncharacterized protein n=1 Tax=Conoideocrella luteorostrata TaxID=1105319 RepID=A0AAJ0CTR1_9HYPO|nr:hypothetical protein QQS21_003728 [Conoideocrella luteorostrata]
MSVPEQTATSMNGLTFSMLWNGGDAGMKYCNEMTLQTEPQEPRLAEWLEEAERQAWPTNQSRFNAVDPHCLIPSRRLIKREI